MPRPSHAFAPLVFCAALAAQAPPCIAMNDSTNASGPAITPTGSAPNVLAYRFTPAAAHVLQAAEIFTATPTATTSGYMTLEVWSEDPTTNLPGIRLCGGTWQCDASLGVGWHGANFDGIAFVQSATNYWLVWREPGGSRVPYENLGVTTTVARLLNGAWIGLMQGQPLKWRGYCSQLDGANVTPTGVGCLSAAGSLPAVFTNHEPLIGNADFRFEATGFDAGVPALAILGANPSWPSLPLPGAPANCFLHNEALVLVFVAVGIGDEQALHSVGRAGHCRLDLPLPPNALLFGVQFDAQFAALDPGSVDPIPFVFSSGVRVLLF